MKPEIRNEEMEIDQERPLPANDGSVLSKGCEETTVHANLFRMELDPNMTIFKYRIDIKKLRADKEIDLTRGPKSDVSSQHRRRVCRSLFEDAIKKAQKSGTTLISDKYKYLYDCGNIAYSSEPFTGPLKGDSKIIAISLLPKQKEVSSDFSLNFIGRQCEEVLVTIEPTIEFSYSVTNSADKLRESQQFLEILTSSLLFKNGDHFTFGNKFYPKSTKYDVDIGEGKSIKPGFAKSCRIGELRGRPVAFVQIDAKKSPFFNGAPVMDFCVQFLNKRSKEDLECLDRVAVRRLRDQLKGLVVSTQYTERDKKRYFPIAGISDKTVKEVTFDVDDKPTNMVKFMKNKYDYHIKYPETFCVTERGRKTVNMYPMEAIEIERGQRVNCQKATKAMGEKQIKECRMNPLDLQTNVEYALKDCLLNDDNKYLQNFKVKVSTKWEGVPATVMYPPAIQYGNSVTEPTRDGTLNWKLGRETFFKCGTIRRLVFIIFDGCIEEQNSWAFIDKILKAAYDHGMDVPEARDVEIEYMNSEVANDIENIFAKMGRVENAYIMGVTKNKFDEVHATMKVFEAKYGVIGQHVSQQTLLKAIGNQGAYLVINNLIMKMNPKAKGVNHSVALSKAYLDKNVNKANSAKNIYHENRMIIGFDVSHAGPQSFADRALKVNQSEPSVVGMSWSLSSSTHQGGDYWLQEPRLARISKIAEYTAKALLEYKGLMKKLPGDIVVYRGGVSEGEFQKVIQEIDELQAAFGMVGEKLYMPSVTCVVVMTNSNFRLLPERIDSRDKPMNQNVWPGTVVNSTITNPYYNEFILVSQKGIMGTVRPTRCVTVYASKGKSGVILNNDEIQQLTYGLTYGHQVVCASTALPLPLTAATNLSKRGRNNWKEVNFHDSDARSALSGGSGDGIMKHDGSDDFFEKMTNTIKSRVNHHFWA